MQKEKIRNSILGILAFVLLFYEIFVLKGENYYLVSMAVLLIALFGFFAHFEKERPGVMLLTMIASLCALAIAGRIADHRRPQLSGGGGHGGMRGTFLCCAGDWAEDRPLSPAGERPGLCLQGH